MHRSNTLDIMHKKTDGLDNREMATHYIVLCEMIVSSRMNQIHWCYYYCTVYCGCYYYCHCHLNISELSVMTVVVMHSQKSVISVVMHQT